MYVIANSKWIVKIRLNGLKLWWSDEKLFFSKIIFEEMFNAHKKGFQAKSLNWLNWDQAFQIEPV
jgi:hypothetical protein